MGAGSSWFRWGSCWRCGPGREPSTSSSTPSRSCTARADIRGIVRTRALSFSLYLAALVVRGRHHPAGAARSDHHRRLAAGAGAVPGVALLARRRRRHDGRAHHALPRGHAAQKTRWWRDVAGCRPGAGHLGAGLVRGPRRCRPVARRHARSTDRCRRRSSCSSGCMRWRSPSSSVPVSTRRPGCCGRSRCGSHPRPALVEWARSEMERATVVRGGRGRRPARRPDGDGAAVSGPGLALRGVSAGASGRPREPAAACGRGLGLGIAWQFRYCLPAPSGEVTPLVFART